MKTGDNYQVFNQRWKPESIQHLKNTFLFRYQSFLIKKILRHHLDIYIYKIADLGCGVGIHTAMLAKTFPNAQVQGFDFTEEGIKAAKAAHQHDNLSFHLGDITKEDFGQFDLISMFEVLEHIEDWQSALTSIAKKTNKYLFFSFPTGRMRNYEIPGGHYRNFKKNEVETFLAQLGFEAMTVWYSGFPFFSPLYRDVCSLFPLSIRQELHNNISNKKISWLHPIMYFFCMLLINT